MPQATRLERPTILILLIASLMLAVRVQHQFEPSRRTRGGQVFCSAWRPCPSPRNQAGADPGRRERRAAHFVPSTTLLCAPSHIPSAYPFINQWFTGGLQDKADRRKESFGNSYNLRWVLLALFGATMGQGVVWYTGQFYALYYLQNIFKVPLVDSNLIVAGALVVGTPFFVLMGALSDRIGRKKIMLTGMALAAITYLPIYKMMAGFAPFIGNPADKVVNPAYSPFMLGMFVFIQVIYVTMVYGPIAAFLVELFPTKIRYTSMSLPYHIGNGVFGGLVPIIGLSLIQSTGNNFAGLYYPITIATVCFLIGLIFVKETNQVDIEDATQATASQAMTATASAGK